MEKVTTKQLIKGRCYKSRKYATLFKLKENVEELDCISGDAEPVYRVEFDNKWQVSSPILTPSAGLYVLADEEFEEIPEKDLFKAIKLKEVAENGIKAIINSK